MDADIPEDVVLDIGKNFLILAKAAYTQARNQTSMGVFLTLPASGYLAAILQTLQGSSIASPPAEKQATDSWDRETLSNIQAHLRGLGIL